MAWSSTGTQSGTDTSLSTITSVTGVLVNVSPNGHKTYQVPTTISLLTVTGNLSWDSDFETLECSESTRIEVNAGATVTIGKATTINGKIRYSKGTGLIMNKQQGSPFINTSACNIWVKASTSLALGGKFIINGSRVMSGGGIFCGNSTTPTNNFVTFEMNGSSVLQNINTTQTMQMIRCFCEPSGINLNNGVIDGRTLGGLPFSNAGWGTLSVSLEFGNFQCDGNGAAAPVTVPNAVLANNVSTFDYAYVANSNDKTKINKYIFKNSDVGSALRTLGQTGTAWRLGVVEITKDIVFNITDGAGLGVENAVTYTKMLGATLNPSIGSRYYGIDDYMTPRVYINTTNTTGSTLSSNILYAVAQGYATDATGAGTALTMDSLTSKSLDIHDKNYIWSYGHLVGQPSTSMRGINTLTQGWTLFNDVNVTLSRTAANALIGTKFTFNPSTKVITVIGDATFDDLYDANKAFKCSTTQTQIETPVIDELILTPNGSNLDAYSGWTLNVNSGITLTNGVKFNKIYFDSINLIGTGSITAVYQTTGGTSTVLSISGYDNGSAVFVEDDLAVQQFYSSAVTGTTTMYLAPSATGENWYYAVEKYGNQRQSDYFVVLGGYQNIVVKALQDVGISQSNVATVAAYTQLETADKIYDYCAYYRLSVPGISYGQIVFKDGTALYLEDNSMVVNQSASDVFDFDYGTGIITIKALTLSEGAVYNLIKADAPGTITPATTELIFINIEDANGDSALTPLGGDGNFELWKIPTSTATDDYATGVLLDTITNEKWRFNGVVGFDIVGRDTNSGIRRRTSMAKGIYTQSFYVGDQIQLAQAPQVDQINNKVDAMQVDLTAIKGVGFDTANDSLTVISDKVDAIQNDLDISFSGLTADLNIINVGVQDASIFIPHDTNL